MKAPLFIKGLTVALLLLVLPGVAAMLWTFNRMEEATQARRVSGDLLINANQFLVNLNNAESAQRGFILTGDESYLRPYTSAHLALPQDMQALRAETLTPAAQAHLDAAAPLLQDKLLELSQSIAARQLHDLNSALLIVATGRGKKLMEGVRTEMAAFAEIEERAVDHYDTEYRYHLRNLYGGLVLSSALALLSALYFVYTLVRKERERLSKLLHLKTQDLLVAQNASDALTKEYAVQQAETALRKNGALQSAIFNSANFSSIATDARGVIQIFNVGAERMLGYSAQEVMNKVTPAEISDPQEIMARAQTLSAELGVQIQPGFEALVFKATRGIEDIYELTYIRKDGSRFPAVVSVTALRDEDKAIIGYLLIGTDNTARKAVEAERQRLDQVLQDKNVELQLARVEADKANQAKSEFLAHMSHEIRTPLSTINISSYLALKSDLDERQRGHVDRIRQATEHLQSIVNDVLDFTKIEAGKVEIEAVSFAWADVLSQMDSIVGQQARAKGLQFTLNTDAQVPDRLLGDPVRVAQVLVNLAHNAVKFTLNGSVRVSTEVLRTDGAAVMLRVAVTDTGVGIPTEQMGQLFQAFHQLDSGATRPTGGTGLGLVICKQLVMLMGGDMGVTSEHGQGSRFWFTLTLGVPAQVVPSSATAALDTSPQLQGLRLLLVDDSEAYQQVAAELLQRAGAQVVLATSGQEALDQLAQQRFDAVLMDIQMPGMDGLEATRRIRQHPPWANLPVIAMTANARLEERERCHLAGVTDFVAKPFHPPTLIRLIAHICHSRRTPMLVPALAASDAAGVAGAVQCGPGERGGEQ